MARVLTFPRACRARCVPVSRVAYGDSRSFTEQAAVLLSCAAAGPPVAVTTFARRGSGVRVPLSSTQLTQRVLPQLIRESLDEMKAVTAAGGAESRPVWVRPRGRFGRAVARSQLPR